MNMSKTGGEPPTMGKPTKLRPDFVQNAHRVVMEATGQWPKTNPPGERSDSEKHHEAVRIGRKGGQDRALQDQH